LEDSTPGPLPPEQAEGAAVDNPETHGVDLSIPEPSARFHPFSKSSLQPAPRPIDCLECGQTQSITPDPGYAPCIHCRVPIPLHDVTIDSLHTDRVVTRGDVLITRHGQLRGATVQCFNLTIEGTFEGGAECNGELLILHRADISGRLQCGTLTLGRRADLKLEYPARANSITIGGKVHGDLVCSGHVTLLEHAMVLGDIKAGSLSVHDGAHHVGLVHMSSASLAARVSAAMEDDEA
jgi:cytoskeletal protein CcmA (bactofilin family)